VVLEGCVELQITQAINQYQAAESKVKLGDSKEDVLAILQPTQAILNGHLKRGADHWIDPKSGKTVDLYYFRSGLQRDGRLTDNELTPYLFIDNTLVAIGWNALRGLAIQPQAKFPDVEMDYTPPLENTTLLDEYSLGSKYKAVFRQHSPSEQQSKKTKYLYSLEVLSVSDSDPVLYVTSELNRFWE